MSLYDEIGKGYSLGRKSDPRIAKQIHSLIEGADSVLNLGAGGGSYEPTDIPLIALEPSSLMIAQRPSASPPCVQASVEKIPFCDNSFTHTMTVLSIHHWDDRRLAFEEIKRVTKDKFIALTWDPESEPFWLTETYFPEIHAIDTAIFPQLSELEIAFPGIEFLDVNIPIDCTDGFLAAFWARPQAYLDEKVRQSISTFSKIKSLRGGLQRLKRDLDSGAWGSAYGHLLSQRNLDAGYKLAVWQKADNY